MFLPKGQLILQLKQSHTLLWHLRITITLWNRNRNRNCCDLHKGFYTIYLDFEPIISSQGNSDAQREGERETVDRKMSTHGCYIIQANFCLEKQRSNIKDLASFDWLIVRRMLPNIIVRSLLTLYYFKPCDIYQESCVLVVKCVMKLLWVVGSNNKFLLFHFFSKFN